MCNLYEFSFSSSFPFNAIAMATLNCSFHFFFYAVVVLRQVISLTQGHEKFSSFSSLPVTQQKAISFLSFHFFFFLFLFGSIVVSITTASPPLFLIILFFAKNIFTLFRHFHRTNFSCSYHAHTHTMEENFASSDEIIDRYKNKRETKLCSTLMEDYILHLLSPFSTNNNLLSSCLEGITEREEEGKEK